MNALRLHGNAVIGQTINVNGGWHMSYRSFL